MRNKKMLILLAVAVMLLAEGSRPVCANGRETVLKSSEVESKGRIKGQDGFLYDGEDIQNLADDMALLYRLCQ